MVTSTTAEAGVLKALPALNRDAFAAARRAMVFEYEKWDPQVQDTCVLSPVALSITRAGWEEIGRLSEGLYAEALGAEREILRRPELIGRLGLPRACRRVMERMSESREGCDDVRVMRFDFHVTREGWRITEVNSDVPGGYNEASGLPRVFAGHHAGVETGTDPAAVMAEALTLRALKSGGVVAMVHATGYADDTQLTAYMGKLLKARGVEAVACAPDHLAWEGGKAFLNVSWAKRASVEVVFRLFPGDWLQNLGRRAAWEKYFTGEVAMANPASALVTQAKVWPVLWDELETRLPTWRKLLPRTVRPGWREIGDLERWVIKPNLGRVGEGVVMGGITPEKEVKRAQWEARLFPGDWVAQERFESVAVESEMGLLHACVGAYVVDGHFAGTYCRVSSRGLTDCHARDSALFIEKDREA